LPTVTDANLLLGRLRPDRFLGGEFRLDFERTRRIVSDWLHKQQSRLSLEQFASGVIRVVNATMEKAIRVVSIERGYDARDFALVAFGGAGGLHACELAEALGIPQVIVPALPGALSAYGILVSDVVKDYSRTVLWRVTGTLPRKKIDAEFRLLARAAVKDFRSEQWKGSIQNFFSVDVRYRGQGYELNIPYTSKLLDNFRAQHRRRYGYDYENREIELVTLRLRAAMKSSAMDAAATVSVLSRKKINSKTTLVEKCRVAFAGKKIETAIYDRDLLGHGKQYRGPAVVTEYSATTVVPSGKLFGLDSAGNLIIRMR